MKATSELRLAMPVEHGERSAALVADLDGTVVKTDLLLESVLALLKQKPRFIFYLPVWLLRGKAHFKQQVADRVVLAARV
jgi:hypothetical protein